MAVGAIALVHRWLLHDEAPRVVLALAVGAMALRLALGLLFARALPEWGYDENPQNAGYVFWDAYKRDADAWQRARGDLPLVTSFTEPKVSDQYGGLLFVSAGAYRYLSGGIHRPLMVVVLTAAASGIAVLFIWAFAHVAMGPPVGVAAAWIATFAPEGILLGASQMREPFLIAGLAVCLYGYVLSRPKGPGRGGRWVLGGLALLLFFSPPTALAAAATLAALTLWEGREAPRIPRWAWWAGLLFAAAALLIAIRSWARLEQIGGSFETVILQWWENAGAAWRVGQAAEGSDMLQVMLDRLPGAARLPFLVGYGLVQPFLPAAIAAPGIALWKTIAIVRGLGWFALLPLLVYGTVAAFRRRGPRSLEAYLGLLVWVTALLASYRAPGYQWDNPRYRTVLLVAQASLAGWAWVSARANRDPWLGRTYISLGIATTVVLAWYLGRYADLPSLTLEGTLVACVVLVAGYLGACVLRDRRAHASETIVRGPPGV
jgi:hypothetical protein